MEENNIPCDIKILVMERTKEIVLNITEMECYFNDIYCYINGDSLTDEAKEIFDYYYNEEYEKQLEFVKNIINIIDKLPIG